MLTFEVDGCRTCVMVEKIMGFCESATDRTCTILLDNDTELRVYLEYEELYARIKKARDEYLAR